ncbi:GGDEF domain-containing protein [Lysinibacillus sp. MHQ-1]|nr:GGDEF domain-containing protein [Lysinibacillus sp. MHQ-1]
MPKGCSKKAAESNQQLALMMVDLDHFKEINDMNGHLFGDDALTNTAKTLQDYFQPFEAIVARFGGDEFIILSQVKEGGKRCKHWPTTSIKP